MRQKSNSPETPSERLVRDIRRATRKQYSAEEKIRIVLDGLRGEVTIAELCRREGIAESLVLQLVERIPRSRQTASRRRHGSVGHNQRSQRPQAPGPGAERGCRRASPRTPSAQKHDRGWGRRGIRYPPSEKLEIISIVEQSHLPVRRTLDKLGILPGSFYRWYDRYQSGGIEALADKSSKPTRVWNRIPNIPNRSNRKTKYRWTKALYRQRNLVERFFNKLKGTSNNSAFHWRSNQIGCADIRGFVGGGMRQAGSFDVDRRLEVISAKGIPLETIRPPWRVASPPRSRQRHATKPEEKKSAAGRPGYLDHRPEVEDGRLPRSTISPDEQLEDPGPRPALVHALPRSRAARPGSGCDHDLAVPRGAGRGQADRNVVRAVRPASGGQGLHRARRPDHRRHHRVGAEAAQLARGKRDGQGR